MAAGTGRVLVVEDEDEIRDLLALHLKRERFQVETVATAEDAIKQLETQRFDLLVLDWMLPGMSGVGLARHVRAQKFNEPSILMVTAKDDPDDIVRGLDEGADDYLTKPFEPSVLIARARALMRRHHRPSDENAKLIEDEAVLRIGRLSINSETYQARCGEQILSLTPSEFKLLLALARNRGRVLTRDGLIACVQGEGVSVVGRTVDTHVFGLRKKLGECSEILETVRGVGYRVRPDAE